MNQYFRIRQKNNRLSNFLIKIGNFLIKANVCRAVIIRVLRSVSQSVSLTCIVYVCIRVCVCVYTYTHTRIHNKCIHTYVYIRFSIPSYIFVYSCCEYSCCLSTFVYHCIFKPQYPAWVITKETENKRCLSNLHKYLEIEFVI